MVSKSRWYCTEIVNSTIYNTVGDKTIYAKWSEKSYNVVFLKINSLTRAPVQGVQFSLTGTDYNGDSITLTTTSDKDGIVKFEVPVGVYEATETLSLPSYHLNTDVIDVVVEDK